MNVIKPKRGPLKIRKIHFTKESTDNFNYLLQKESWQESISKRDVNTSFMEIILYLCDIAFPLKTLHRGNIKKINGSPKEYVIYVNE
jgi:hypothetical protein